MDNYAKTILRNKIRRLARRKVFTNKRIVIFGASVAAKEIKSCLAEMNFAPDAIVDNDARRVGKECMGLVVRYPEEELLPFDGEVAILVLSTVFFREMSLQLAKMGYEGNRHFFVLNRKLDESWGSIAYMTARLLRGLWTYRGLTDGRGKKTVFIAPYTGTGDIYLAGLFFWQYLEKSNITDYVFVVVSNACKKVAEKFSIKHIVVKKPMVADDIILASRFLRQKWPVIVLNDGWMNEPLQWIRGYKGLHFEQTFRHFVFDFDDDVMHQPPPLDDCEAELGALFARHGLIKGRTVVLSPYSNTLFEMPDNCWEFIASHCKSRGFTVCTNCAGPNEKPVAGTAPVFFPLGQAIEFLNMAGYFVGVRNGLCDIISTSTCKKVILYERDGFFYKCSPYDYFSLCKLGLSEEALEIQYHSTLQDEVLNKIFTIFQ